MEYQELIGKVLADKESKKIGLIVDIKYSASTAFSKDKANASMIVRVQRPLKSDFLIELDANKVFKIEKHYVWMDCTRKEYLQLLKKAPRAKSEMKLYKNLDLTVLKGYRPPGH